MGFIIINSDCMRVSAQKFSDYSCLHIEQVNNIIITYKSIFFQLSILGLVSMGPWSKNFNVFHFKNFNYSKRRYRISVLKLKMDNRMITICVIWNRVSSTLLDSISDLFLKSSFLLVICFLKSYSFILKLLLDCRIT